MGSPAPIQVQIALDAYEFDHALAAVERIISLELRRGATMGYVPPPYPSPKLNVDRFGLPRDYATYMWLVYRQRVDDRSPERVAFLEGPKMGGIPNFGQQVCWR